MDLWAHCFLNQPPIFDLGLCCAALKASIWPIRMMTLVGVSTSAAIGIDRKAANLYTSPFPQESSLLHPGPPSAAYRVRQKVSGQSRFYTQIGLFPLVLAQPPQHKYAIKFERLPLNIFFSLIHEI